MSRPPLTELERELLALCSLSGETTTTLHEEMLEHDHAGSTVETVLHGLARRGLLSTYRGVYDGVQRARDDPSRAWDRRYEDDWWQVTAEGRRALQET
jgi:predicted transcriptional regulator